MDSEQGTALYVARRAESECKRSIQEMKITIPAEWVLGRWWQNRILWLIWLLGAVMMITIWIQNRGPIRAYLLAYFIASSAAALGFAMGDWTGQRQDADRRYKLPGEK